MALSKKKASGEKQTITHVFTDVRVVRAHDFGNGQIAFDAVFNDLVQVYGMKYIEGTKHDGTEYSFVSFPQIKGKDGNYYNRVYLVIDDDLKESIISQLEILLDA